MLYIPARREEKRRGEWEEEDRDRKEGTRLERERGERWRKEGYGKEEREVREEI